jgi:hypothetical protein
MRNGVEIWKEEERINELIKALQVGKVGYVTIDGEVINSVDIVGIFSPETMADYTNRKNGMWKCKFGKWHNRGSYCNCVERRAKEKIISDGYKYING